MRVRWRPVASGGARVPLSLRHLAIITAIEDEFQIQLSMDVIMEIDGIAKLGDAVSQALATA